MIVRCIAALMLLLACLLNGTQAGLYYSGEPFTDLPSQWRGFLLDQRLLRNIALKPTAAVPASPARVQYQEAVSKLEKFRRSKQLSTEEAADFGALYIRLGEVTKAIEVLQAAQREHPHHFRLVANLGTAWQLQGDLPQAQAYLLQAVRLAPGKLQRAEASQLRLVQLRQREGRSVEKLDDLFGVHYGGEGGKYQPGKMAAAEVKKLPSDAAAVLQQLALWLPADGRILWQLGELANAYGNVKVAAGIFEGCVTEFGLRDPELREHRQLTRAAAEELARYEEPGARFGAGAHEGSAGLFRPRSKRPLLTKLDQEALPAIQADGTNALPWSVLSDTQLDRKYRPSFSHYLQELNGKKVLLTGFMQPLNEDLDSSSFLLIENPVGCWYCEMPEITGMVLVEMPPNKTATFTRSLVKVEGKLKLNATDPENFLFTLSQAKVSGAD
jgi:tetratricopeptide (TPR) repeat protein